jgi:hypothetical protein
LLKFCGNRFNEQIRDNDGPSIRLVAGDFFGFEPAVGGAVGDAQFPSIDTHLHIPRLAQMFLIVNICIQTE